MKRARGSLTIVLLLLSSVGTASAECAWVLWAYAHGGRGPTAWGPLLSRDTRGDCEAAQAMIQKVAKEEGRLSPLMSCFPDTIDPRGPKTK
jgi:hypothetical protein